MQFITPEIYVSAVTEKCIVESDYKGVTETAKPAAAEDGPKSKTRRKKRSQLQSGKKKESSSRSEKALGNVVSKFFQAGRETIEMIIKTCFHLWHLRVPFWGSSVPGLGNVIADDLPTVQYLTEMLGISLCMCAAVPVTDPGIYGAVIAQVVETLLEPSSRLQTSQPSMRCRPVCHRAQVGADFVPVGLSLGESEPETIEMGVPAVLFSRS